MVALELIFYPREDSRGDEYDQFDDGLEHFLSSLRGNGNIFDNWTILELKDCVQVRTSAPEAEAIDQKNWSIYGPLALQRLRLTCSQDPVFRVVDAEDNSCCQCLERGIYILHTSHRDTGLPVDCGDCLLPVPLYKLPHINGEQEHWTLRSWQKIYAALDELWWGSYIGERFSYRHLTSPHSELIKSGREITAQFEKLTGKPFYVFLMPPNGNFGENCPCCKRLWRLEEPWLDSYLFKCDHCHLISKEIERDATPLSELFP